MGKRRRYQMNRFKKRGIVVFLTAVMIFGSVTTAMAAGSPTTSTPGDDTTTISEDYVSQVNASSDSGDKVKTSEAGKAAIQKVEKTTKTTIKVDSTVTVDGVKYEVVRVAANAFSKNKQVKTITLPSTIKTISKNAFAGLSKLKTIKINVKKNIKVEKGAFGSINTKKVTITVNKKTSSKELKKIQKTLKAAGFKGKVKRA
jgi:hypothetical protein